jgi:hypothetical protein
MRCVFVYTKTFAACLENLTSQNVRKGARGTTAKHYMFRLKPEVSDLLWRLKDIEGMSRSEIVERAIIRLARRRGIEHP